MLLDRERKIRAALHRRVIGNDHALPARNPTDTADHASADGLVAVKTVGRQCCDLKERRAGVQKPEHPVPRQQLAACNMTLTVLLRTARRRSSHLCAQLLRQGTIVSGVRLEFLGPSINPTGELH